MGENEEQQNRKSLDRFFDYFKHVSTVGTAASVLLVAFGEDNVSIPVLSTFCLAVFTAMLALMSMTFTEHLIPGRYNASSIEVVFLFLSGAFFGGGIVGLIFFALF